MAALVGYAMLDKITVTGGYYVRFRFQSMRELSAIGRQSCLRLARLTE